MWHERNGLRFVDRLETLPDQEGRHRGLNLTYAVRDGTVCHCGEIHDESLKPRDEYIDLAGIRDRRQQPTPFTWEGCVRRIADRISFLGRDIEDALELGLLDPHERVGDASLREMNNGVLIHRLIIDLCRSSVAGEGLRFSGKSYGMMGDVHEFSRECIYSHPWIRECITACERSHPGPVLSPSG